MDVRRRHGRRTSGHFHVRGTADMPELREHAPTLRVDGVRDSPPSRDLLVGIHSRRSEPSAARNRNRGCLGDDKTAFRSALRTVLKHQFTGDITWLLRSRTCEGRHHDAMTQSYRPNCYRREKPSMYSHVFFKASAVRYLLRRNVLWVSGRLTFRRSLRTQRGNRVQDGRVRVDNLAQCIMSPPRSAP